MNKYTKVQPEATVPEAAPLLGLLLIKGLHAICYSDLGTVMFTFTWFSTSLIKSFKSNWKFGS